MANHDFGPYDITLKLSIADDFLPARAPSEETSGSTILRFSHGKVQVLDDAAYDVELAMDVASFSSLWMGAVDCKSLLRLGMAAVSVDDSVTLDKLQSLFRTDTKPMCLMHF